MLVIGVVAFKRKTSLYWVAGVLAGYVLVKYLTRFEHLSNEDKTKRLAQIAKDIEYLKSVGLTESSDNETMKKLVAERKSLTDPPVPKTVTMAAPEPTKVPEKKEPWSLCSIQS